MSEVQLDYLLPSTGLDSLAKMLYRDHIFYFVADMLSPLRRTAIFRKRLKKLGENCIINNGTRMAPLSSISIGDDVWIGADCQIFSHHNWPVEIDDHTLLGPGVLITTLGHDTVKNVSTLLVGGLLLSPFCGLEHARSYFRVLQLEKERWLPLEAL